MRRSLVRLMWALMLCSSSTAVRAETPGQWTLLLYMVTEDDASEGLEESAITHLDSIAAAGLPSGVRVIAQVDRGKKHSDRMRPDRFPANDSGTRLFEVVRGDWRHLESLGEVNSGDPASLLNFVRRGQALAPAEHYLLVIDCHGSGILSWSGPGSVGNPEPGSQSFVAYDDTDDDSLTLWELSRSLRTLRRERGKPIEILAFDNCWSAMAEALYQVRDGADILVGTPAIMPLTGFLYPPILEALGQGPLEPEALAFQMIEAFKAAPTTRDRLLGAFRVASSVSMVPAIDRLAIEIHRAQTAIGPLGIRPTTVFGAFPEFGFGGPYYRDLKQITDRILSPESRVSQAPNADALREAARDLGHELEAATINRMVAGEFSRLGLGGLSIYWPDRAEHLRFREFYRTLELPQRTHWRDVVDQSEGVPAP